MSHFNVAVFSRKPADIYGQLLPFCEQVDADSPYAVFKEEPDADVDETTGRRGYWYNPNAKWDWWEVGGRWKRTLRLLPGRKGRCGEPDTRDEDEAREEGTCDRAWALDCDFSRDESKYAKACRFWELVVEKAEPTDENEDMYARLYSAEHLTSRYGDKEAFANNVAACFPFAFITADGEWHSQGNMGCFGFSDGTRESCEAFYKEYQKYREYAQTENLYITIVDCHI